MGKKGLEKDRDQGGGTIGPSGSLTMQGGGISRKKRRVRWPRAVKGKQGGKFEKEQAPRKPSVHGPTSGFGIRGKKPARGGKEHLNGKRRGKKSGGGHPHENPPFQINNTKGLIL